MPEKRFFIENIGNVKIRKSRRSKNISISIRPQKGVTVSLPYYLSYKYGLKILEQKRDWIEKQIPKVKAIEQQAFHFNENTHFNTQKRKIEITAHQSEKIKAIKNNDRIQIFYPKSEDVRSKEIQDSIKGIVIKILREEAKEYLPIRTEQIAKKLNFNYNRIFIKNNKTLWGSCSAKNNINLNLHLVLLPSYLIDYVIVHELCHTIEKNHGPRFWKLMDSILGDSKKLSKELKQFSIQFN